jgi:hypothetical protein
MSRFVTRWTGKTARSPSVSAAEKREAFADAVATLRQATGKAERRTLPCRCAVTGKSFVVVFERTQPARPFEIARIEQAAGGEDRPAASRGRFAAGPRQDSFDAAEFDWSGYACPHCGTREGVVYCDQCGETVCAGRARRQPDGTRAFTCHDQCGATGTIAPATHVHGAVTGNAAMLQLTGPKTLKALPRPARFSAPRQK